MATNRSLLCTFLMLLSIIITISANRLVDRLANQAMNNNSHINQLPDQLNRDRDFFLRCFWLFKRYRFPVDKYDSVQDELENEICSTGSRLVWQPTYENTGRLPPGYKEALLIWHNYNQTIVDIEICQYDHRHCPEELKEIAFSSYWLNKICMNEENIVI